MADHALQGQGRESGCPVHFIWDGRGLGRWPVRLGFLTACVAGALSTASGLLRLPWLNQAAGMVAAGALVAWCAGQVLGRVHR